MVNSIEVIPGLTLTETMYEAAAEGVREFTPELHPLSYERFTRPTEWALIPDECLDTVKAELVLSDWPDALTRKINVWFRADLRGGERPKPHNHPWEFTSRILLGGYVEDRYTLDGDQVRVEHGVTHRFGSSNHVPKDLYHEVTDIAEPGATMTLMVCERGVKGDWGHLDVDRRVHRPIERDPDFAARFEALNPHLR